MHKAKQAGNAYCRADNQAGAVFWWDTPFLDSVQLASKVWKISACGIGCDQRARMRENLASVLVRTDKELD